MVRAVGREYFLFAATVRFTLDYSSRRDLFGAAGILGRLEMVFSATAPVHGFYRSIASKVAGLVGFAVVEAEREYGVHRVVLFTLYGSGTGLFWAGSIAISRRTFSLAPSRPSILILVI